MHDFLREPVYVLVASSIVLGLAAWIGAKASQLLPLNSNMRGDFNILMGAALTLLALIIGFSFSMAANRYDQRKNLEEAEANAIGTEYVRAQLLPAADAAKVQALLKAYLDLRVQFYEVIDAPTRSANAIATAKAQGDLWAAILPAAGASPTPVMALVVSGMNDVLNAQGYVQAAFWNRIPGSTWGLLGTIAVCCNLMVGYGLRTLVKARHIMFVLPIFLSIVVGFIVDIDSPRRGVVQVAPQNLVSLAKSLPG
jgi:hypothetical protein